MSARSWVLCFLIVGGTALLFPVQTVAQTQPRPPSQQTSSVQATSAVPIESLPPVETDALRVEDEERSDQIGPYRYGRAVDVNMTPQQHGTWESLPSGDWLWRLRIQSAEARSLSLGFNRFQLPEGASLFVYGPDGDLTRGPYTNADATNGQHWTPIIRGEEVILELEVPSNQRSAVNLTLGTVVHGYRSPFPTRNQTAQRKAGACNLDVACDEADPWRDQVRSVGRYTYVQDDFSFFCTGSLVNNTEKDATPFFLTAEHCISTPEQASSMVIYWNYQNQNCRERGTPENEEVTELTDQTSSGTTLIARYGRVHEEGRIAGKPDLALVRIDEDDIDPSYNLFFSGWSWEDTPTSRSVTIHHPQGHGKRISFDEDASSVTAFGASSSGNTHLRVGNWELGTTEGGSSGAGLFNTNRRIVGVLSGGAAGCVSGSAEDNDEPDWYGRLAAGFERGDYTPDGFQQPATFADWLDPNDSGRKTLGGRDLEGDAVPPGLVSDFGVQTVTPDSVTLIWTAPADDGTNPESGPVQDYLLRYRTNEPISSTSDFENAQPVPNVPTPKAPGNTQSATIAVQEDSSYYFGLVARDQNENESPLATTTRDITPVSSLRILSPPTPNPARRQSTIQFGVRTAQTVQAALYDPLGRRVSILFDERVTPFRRRSLSVDVSSLSSGMYFLRVRGESSARTVQIAVVE